MAPENLGSSCMDYFNDGKNLILFSLYGTDALKLILLLKHWNRNEALI